jgi:ATP dependent DNA ligase domain
VTRGVASDHKLLHQIDSRLYPKPRALSRKIDAVRAFGDHPFQMVLSDKAHDVRGRLRNLNDLNSIIRHDNLAEDLTAFSERKLQYEIKLDGYRMIAVRNAKPEIYSRLKNSVTRKFPYIAEALTSLPEGTVLDGELVALDAAGKPDFNLLQNFRSAESHIFYFVFDILAHEGRSLRTSQILQAACRPPDTPWALQNRV